MVPLFQKSVSLWLFVNILVKFEIKKSPSTLFECAATSACTHISPQHIFFEMATSWETAKSTKNSPKGWLIGDIFSTRPPMKTFFFALSSLASTTSKSIVLTLVLFVNPPIRRRAESASVYLNHYSITSLRSLAQHWNRSPGVVNIWL